MPVSLRTTLPATVTIVVYNQGDTATALTATGTGLLWYTTATGGTGSTSAPTPSTATMGTTSYWVTQTLNGCESERIKIDVIVTLNGQSASGLKFDGINDYIDCGNAITASLATANKFTFETWVKTNNVSTGQLIFGNHSTENAGASQASLRIVNDRYEILLGHGNYSLMTPPGSVIANTWQHVAASWDGTNLKIFINGVLSNSLVISSYNLSNTNEKMYFGKNVYNDIFSGMIDETRIWNIALTDTEIQNSYNCEIANQAGLIAYYRFNQGTSGVDNTALTTLTDLATNTNNGTLYNFNLTGYNSNWTAFDGSPLAPISYNQTFCSSTNPTVANLQVSGNGGGTFNWYDSASGGTPLATSTSLTTGTYYVSKVNGSCENSRFSINVIVSNVSVPTVTTPDAYNQGDTASPLSATTGTNGTGLMWYTTATGGTGSTSAPTPDTSTAGSTSYWVSSTNANGCESERVEIMVNVNAEATHLNFDGVDDYVNLGASLNTTLDPLNTITVESWVKPATNTGLGVIVGNYANPLGSQMQFLLRRDGTSYTFWINGTSGIFKVVEAINTVQLNTWQHVAGVWNGTDLKIYVNGVLSGTTTNVTDSSFATSTNSTFIGNNQAGSPEIFTGDIDEVRIWNIARSQTDINNLKDCEAMSQPELIAYYKFNQGYDGVSNTSTTTLLDSAGSNNGTLTNFALTGATSNWKAGSTVATGNTCTVLQNESFNVSTNFKIYPNPTKNIVNIDVLNLDNALVEVYDINGRQLFTQKLNNTTNNVNIENLAAGVYMFKVTSNQGTATSKVIKQ